MMRLKWLQVIFIALLSASAGFGAVSAQDALWNDVWVLAKSESNTGVVVRLSSTGVTQQINVPGGAFIPGAVNEQYVLSPDGRFLVIASQMEGAENTHPVMIADLQNGTTIQANIPPAAAYDLGGFDPAGTRFALSYVSYIPTPAPDTFPYNGGIAIIDASNGALLIDLPMSSNPITPDEFTPWAFVDEWRADGIRFIGSCFGCEPAFEGQWSIWNPDTNEFTAESGEYFSYFGTWLPATNELLMRAHRTNYPYDTEPAYFPRFNVVQYYADGVLPSSSELSGAPVVYFNPNDIDLSDGNGLFWINGGDEFIVTSQTDTTWIATSRFGGQRFVTVPADSSVLAGVNGGWVGTQPNSTGGTSIVSYTLSGGGYQPQVLADIVGSVSLLRAPALGENVAIPPIGFTVIAPPPPDEFNAIMLANAPQCEGASPSRLIIGQLGRVTPGEANRVRTAPSTNAEIVGAIPGGAIFTVLDGPVCSEGYAWWFVEYEGILGFTVEGSGTNYFVEPVTP